MELPNDIWDKIVKQSKKNNIDIVCDMNLQQLDLLEMVIRERKHKLINVINNKLDKYDIIEVCYDLKEYIENGEYIKNYIVIDKNIKDESYIKVCKLNDGNKKTIFGNYSSGSMYNQSLCLISDNIKVKSKLQDRDKENITIANKLNVGDVFCYSIYSCAEWCKKRNRIYEMETFEDGLKYNIVIGMTYSKIITIKYNKTSTNYKYEELEYINKNKVLNKINYNDNQVEYIKAIKHLFTRSLLIIDSIDDTQDYLNKISKNHIRHIIIKQHRIGIRP
tara:strand:- start:48 stop:878 length:831 start_codon:yes stop_codon:yes gene_type:complete